MVNQMDDFKDIAPFKDDDVNLALQSLVQDPEINRYLIKIGKENPWLRRVSKVVPESYIPKMVLSFMLKTISPYSMISDVQSVRGLQEVILKPIAQRVIKNTTTNFDISGEENLAFVNNDDRGTIFISNHRNIIVDPLLVNYVLFHELGMTVENIAGDNLFTDPRAQTLLRLNKTVKFERLSRKGPRRLSTYMDLQLAKDISFWIAQAEGRSKDNLDLTDPTIIRMFYSAVKKQYGSIGEFVNNQNIIPVSLSYEFDPCDHLKAIELYISTLMQKGHYEKSREEDDASMLRGIMGKKGRIKVQFGEVVKGDYTSNEKQAAKQIARDIDVAIHRGQDIYPINLAALASLPENIRMMMPLSSEERREFLLKGEINDFNMGMARIPRNQMETLEEKMDGLTDHDHNNLRKRIKGYNTLPGIERMLCLIYAMPAINATRPSPIYIR